MVGGGSFAEMALEKVHRVHTERLADANGHAHRQAVGAIFIFLNLGKRDPEDRGKIMLGHPSSLA